MYSEVLAQIDKNTERYMIDEMKQEVEELKQETEELKLEAEELKLEAEELKQETEELKQELANNARNLFQNGVSFEIVQNSFKKLSENTLREIYNEVMSSKKNT